MRRGARSPRVCGPAACMVAAGLTLGAGCVQKGAPVVDRPVGVEQTTPRPVAAARPAEPKATAPAPAPDKAAENALEKVGGPKPGAPAPATPVAPAPPLQPGPAAAAGETREGDWRPEVYTVKKGDTLYSIALDHGQAYRDLAAWNSLTDPNLIRVDQQLRVRPPPGWKEPTEDEAVVARALEPAPQIEAKALEPPPVKKTPKAVKLPYSEQALAQLRGVRFKPSAELSPRTPRSDAAAAAERSATGAPTAAVPGGATVAKTAAPSADAPKPASPGPAGSPEVATTRSGAIAWIWPARGPLLHGFSQGSNPKGIAIGGEPGQPILAGAAGKVVYSGSGLRGYGNLVIIKHDATYLSVYAHNRELLVKEGERVTTGQQIAEMGSSDAQRPELHFEIRRLGKPVDPLQYLPAQGG